MITIKLFKYSIYVEYIIGINCLNSFNKNNPNVAK